MHAFGLYKIQPPLAGMYMSSITRFKFISKLGEKLIKANMLLSTISD